VEEYIRQEKDIANKSITSEVDLALLSKGGKAVIFFSSRRGASVMNSTLF